MTLIRSDRFAPPAPGLHEDVAMSDYLSWEAVSKSTLEKLRISPAHARVSEQFVSEATAATTLGTAIHCAILEPEAFEGVYAKLPVGDGRSRAVKEAKAALVAAGKASLSVTDWEICQVLRERAWAKSTVRDLLEQATHIEVSGVFPIPKYPDLMGKIRPDVICADARTCVDLKSAKDASKHGFQRAIGEHAYFLSPGWYLPGLEVLGVECQHWIWIALEKTPPYGVALYTPELHDVERARQECADLLDAYHACHHLNEWPDYPDTVLPIVRPKWA